MNKNKLDSSRNDPDVIKEYQAIVRKLQEEMYTMKNSMAVQEEVIKTFKENEQLKISEIVLANQKDLKMSLKYAQEEISVKNELIEHYEVEIKNLYCTLKESEKNNQHLNNEIEAYKESLNSDSLLEIAAENTTLEQKIEVTQNLRRSAELNADFYKAELEAKNNELKDLTEQLLYYKTEQKGQLRKDELQQIVVTKDEQLRKMNKKFQIMTQKIDNLVKEKESLEETTRNLEKDKKKLMERWKQ